MGQPLVRGIDIGVILVCLAHCRLKIVRGNLSWNPTKEVEHSDVGIKEVSTFLRE